MKWHYKCVLYVGRLAEKKQRRTLSGFAQKREVEIFIYSICILYIFKWYHNNDHDKNGYKKVDGIMLVLFFVSKGRAEDVGEGNS